MHNSDTNRRNKKKKIKTQTKRLKEIKAKATTDSSKRLKRELKWIWWSVHK